MHEDDLPVVVRLVPDRRQDVVDVLLDRVQRGLLLGLAEAPVLRRLLTAEEVVGADHQRHQPRGRVCLQELDREGQLAALVAHVQREQLSVANVLVRRRRVLATVARALRIDQARRRLPGARGVGDAEVKSRPHVPRVVLESRGLVVVGRWLDLRLLIAEGHGVAEREVPRTGTDPGCTARGSRARQGEDRNPGGDTGEPSNTTHTTSNPECRSHYRTRLNRQSCAAHIGGRSRSCP